MAFICKMRYGPAISCGYCKPSMDFPHTELHTLRDLTPHKAALYVRALRGSGHASYQLFCKCCFCGPFSQGSHACSCDLEHHPQLCRPVGKKRFTRVGELFLPAFLWLLDLVEAAFVVKPDVAFAELWLQMEGLWCEGQPPSLPLPLRSSPKRPLFSWLQTPAEEAALSLHPAANCGCQKSAFGCWNTAEEHHLPSWSSFLPRCWVESWFSSLHMDATPSNDT